MTLGTTRQLPTIKSDRPQLTHLNEKHVSEQPLILEQEVESDGQEKVIPSMDLEIQPKNENTSPLLSSHHNEKHEHVIGPFAIMVALSIHGVI